MARFVEMQTVHGDPIRLLRIDDDILHPVFFPPIEDNLEHMQDIEGNPGDILLCRYPKCGGHWLVAIIKFMMEKHIHKTEGNHLVVQPHGLEFQPVSDLASPVTPRLLTTHLWPKRIPKYFHGGNAKIILLLRNPKDVAVSFYFHVKSARDVANKQDWDEFFESFTSGELMFGPYHTYLRAWESELENNKGLKVEVFYYEDFKSNALEMSRRLAKFLGFSLNDGELQLILNECTFTRMKDRANEKSDELPKFECDENGKTVIYRKGEVGNWKRHFTVAQSEMYDSVFRDTVRGDKFSFKFE